MNKEPFEKPLIKIVELDEDIILASDGCYRDNGSGDNPCPSNTCPSYDPNCHTN